MVDNDDARLNHILDAAEEIERFLSGKNEVEFCNDRLLLLGIQKVGEPPNTSSGFWCRILVECTSTR